MTSARGQPNSRSAPRFHTCTRPSLSPATTASAIASSTRAASGLSDMASSCHWYRLAEQMCPRLATMLIVTTNDLPGYRIDEVLGEIFGLTVRSRNAFSQMGAGLKSIIGGELRGMTTALVESRNQVMQRLIDEATKRGANAILAMRFDTSEMGNVWTEICAYGTAVRVTKL